MNYESQEKFNNSKLTSFAAYTKTYIFHIFPTFSALFILYNFKCSNIRLEYFTTWGQEMSHAPIQIWHCRKLRYIVYKMPQSDKMRIKENRG